VFCAYSVKLCATKFFNPCMFPALKNIKRKIIPALVLGFLVLFVYSNFLSSSNEQKDFIATTDLNVRTGPGTRYPVVFTLAKGNEVEVILKNDRWYKIRYEGKKGYAAAEFLAANSSGSDTRIQSVDQTASFIVKGIIVLIALILGFFLYRKVQDHRLVNTVTDTKRGNWSERDLVLKLLRYGIPAPMIFHDLYVRKQNDEFAQIDLVAVTQAGIIVFEVKDYSGWIYGNGNQSQWTQVLDYGRRKFRFYNPVIQNQRHITALKFALRQHDHVPFYSVVIFYGNSTFKDISFIPPGTFLVKSERFSDVMNTILKEKPAFGYDHFDELISILRAAMDNGKSKENQYRHIANVRDMLGTDRVFE